MATPQTVIVTPVEAREIQGESLGSLDSRTDITNYPSTGNTLVQINTSQGAATSGYPIVDNAELPERQGDVLLNFNTGEAFPIDPESGFVDTGGLLVSPEDIPTTTDEEGFITNLNTGERLGVNGDFIESGEGTEFYVSAEDVSNTSGYGSLAEPTEEDVAAAERENAEFQRTGVWANERGKAGELGTGAALQRLRRKAVTDDWRFRIKLAPQANYLYRAAGPGDILYPLQQSNGVIFPYTPAVSVNYRANYDTYDLVHTNYRGYFYKNSSVSEISVQGTFTANSTSDADYVLAVIHFFRSVTKMFYGQDTEQPPGTPPPVVYVRGMGKYQFNEHPCLVSNFSYNLPADVDYIRAGSAAGDYSGGAVNLSQIRNQQGSASSGTVWSASKQRLLSSVVDFIGGGQRSLPAGGQYSSRGSQGQYSVTGSPTYVPTKINISLSLLPLVSRRQQAQEFSLRDFAKGELLSNKGFW